MRRGFVIAAIWIAGTLVTGGIAMAVVSIGGGAFSEDAVRPLSAADVESLGTSTTITSAAPGEDPTALISPGPGVRPESEPPEAAEVTTTAPGVTTTAGGADPPGAEPPAGAAEDATRAFSLPGGTVVVRFGDRGVQLVSASPAPGFRVEILDGGPDSVAVEFESSASEVVFSAEMSGGELVTAEREPGAATGDDLWDDDEAFDDDTADDDEGASDDADDD